VTHEGAGFFCKPCRSAAGQRDYKASSLGGGAIASAVTRPLDEMGTSRAKEHGMSKVRVLVGTRKGAFILTSDGKRDKWDVSGPHFPGWELYHLKGSPADPNRLYASQCSGWFGQVIQRSDDGGKSWEPVGNKFAYDGVPGTHQWYDGTPGSSRASGISSRR
jgi:hypothetical protein